MDVKCFGVFKLMCVWFRIYKLLSYFRFLNVFFGYFGYKITEIEHDQFIFRIYMVLVQLLQTGLNPMGSEQIPY